MNVVRISKTLSQRDKPVILFNGFYFWKLLDFILYNLLWLKLEILNS